jgi:hypothetical protein
MARIVGAIVRIASSVLELLTLKERKKARQERKDEAEAPVQAAEDIRHAVAEGDENKVNQMLEESRLHRTHGGKAVSVLLAALALAGSVFMYGCVIQRKPLVLSADRAVVTMELNGVSGWFVPEATFADMSAAYVAENARMRIREEAMEAIEP